MNDVFPVQEATLHGHRVGFRMAGEGPLIVLLHGITSTSDVWLAAMERLAERYTVVSPDLLGHGRSAKPRGDYSLGAYASGGRDLLGVLGFERGTVVGHSLGGGIALQFAYQFPEYCERLVLVSSGGLGKEVHPLLRAAALPGAELVLPLITRDWAIGAGSAVAGFLDRFGFEAGPDLAEAARGYASLAERGAREAFLHTLRGVIDLEGQRVSATDRLYLAEGLPTLLIWGTDDPIIPIEHGRTARERIPGSQLVEISGAGHWPQLDDPDRFVAELTEFVETTEPYVFELDRMREMLRRGPTQDPDRPPDAELASPA
jgi:pimeloyl-ACP methyl ester carboxylesterase